MNKEDFFLPNDPEYGPRCANEVIQKIIREKKI